MTNKELLQLFIGLNAVKELPGAKFSYAVTRNLEKIKKSIAHLQNSDIPSEKFIKFEEERVKLATSFSRKKEDGSPVMDENGSFVVDDKEEFKKAYAKLAESHKEAIADRKKQIADFNRVLEEEVEIDLYKILQDYLPAEINSKQLAEIMPIVKE